MIGVVEDPTDRSSTSRFQHRARRIPGLQILMTEARTTVRHQDFESSAPYALGPNFAFASYYGRYSDGRKPMLGAFRTA